MTVFNLAARAMMELPGARAGAVVDLESGSCLGRVGNDDTFNLAQACTVNAQMIRAKIRLLREQAPSESIEDMMETLGNQYHLTRLIDLKDASPLLFLYLIVDRKTANLVLARRKLAEVEQAMLQTPEIEKQITDASLSAVLRAPIENRMLSFASVARSEREEVEEELPPFMRDDVVMKLLGLTPGAGLEGSSIYAQ